MTKGDCRDLAFYFGESLSKKAIRSSDSPRERPPVPRKSVFPQTKCPQRSKSSSTPTRVYPWRGSLPAQGAVHHTCHAPGAAQEAGSFTPITKQPRSVNLTARRNWGAKGPPPSSRGLCAPPTRSSPSVRCSPRRRSPTAKSLTHRPPSRLTSRVWNRLHRRSRWSGPPQTAPPHGSTDAGDEAGDEAAEAASGGGEATQRHNTLLTIGREAGAPGAERRRLAGGENTEDTRESPDVERGLLEAGKLAGGAASGSPAPPPAASLATPPGGAGASHRPGRPHGRGGASWRTAHAAPDSPDQWGRRSEPRSACCRFKLKEAGIG